ncbi:MAG: ABC transporter substrate-binding protein [Gammaproteobacteria bacterium]|nr:ABC transporter substrate-binding protein [Gammaproteobacteria bacterium]
MSKIDIIVSRHSAFYSPLISTISADFLKDEGLETSYTAATPDNPSPGAVAAGRAQIGQSAVSNSWGFLERGETSPIVHIAQINERDGFFVAARDPDPDFSWDKLVGSKVIADAGGQPFAMFKFAVHKMGVDFNSIDTIDAGEADAIDKAFRDGQGDYVHLQGPYPQQLEADGIGHVVASVGEAIGPVAFSSIIATPEFAGTDEAKAFMRAYRKSRAYVNETPAAEIAAAEESFFPDIDQAVLAKTIEFYQGLGCWNPDPTISQRAYDVALDVFVHSGIITKRHPYEQVVAPAPGA